jgi:hypothetical protein
MTSNSTMACRVVGDDPYLAAPVALTENASSRVRTTDRQLRALMATAIERSPKFRSLIEKLNDSDVIVYLEAKIIREWVGGYLVSRIVAEGEYRYLRIIVNPRGTDERLITVIAHELQHAIEIAATPAVGRSQTVEEWLAANGFLAGCHLGCYETMEAINIQETVRRELRSSRTARD